MAKLGYRPSVGHDQNQQWRDRMPGVSFWKRLMLKPDYTPSAQSRCPFQEGLSILIDLMAWYVCRQPIQYSGASLCERLVRKRSFRYSCVVVCNSRQPLSMGPIPERISLTPPNRDGNVDYPFAGNTYNLRIATFS